MIGPQEPPHAIEQLSATGEQPSIVACLGSSSTAGKGQAFNWITELQRRLGQRRFVFRNFGVGGDLSYNALQRLSGVIASCPKKMVVLIGGNDVLALVSAKARRFFRLSKRLPRDPSPEWFRENLQAIASRAKAETSAAIALCSLPPIGEDPMSANPFQSELNRRIEEFSAIIRGIAQEEGTDYIALYEAMFCASHEITGSRFHGVRVSFVLSRCFPHSGAAQKSRRSRPNQWLELSQRRRPSQ